MNKFILLLICLIAFSIDVSAATYYLKGTVLDDETGASLEYASVKVLNTRFGGSIDQNGNFEIYVDANKLYTIKISHVGYYSIEDSIYPNSQPKFYYLKVNPAEMEEVVCVGGICEEQPETAPSGGEIEEISSGAEFPSVSMESTAYRDLLKQKSWTNYISTGGMPWKDSAKFRDDTKKICSFGCNAAPWCEGDRSELLDNNGNPLYNNINIKSYCADSTRENPYEDECDGNGVIEYSCKENKCIKEEVKECSSGEVCKDGVCGGEEIDYSKYFILLNDLNKGKRYTFSEINKLISQKLANSDYAALIIGETHHIEEEKEIASMLLEDVAKVRKIDTLLVEKIEGTANEEIFTSSDCYTDNSRLYIEKCEGNQKRKEQLERLKIYLKYSKNKLDPRNEIKDELERAEQGQILVTYTGYMHTDNLLLSYPIFSASLGDWNILENQWITIRDGVEEFDKKAISVIMIDDFEGILEESQNLFIKELVNKKIININKYADNYKNYFSEIVSKFSKSRIFIVSPQNEDSYLSINIIKNGIEYRPISLDIFSVVWSNENIRNKVLNGGYELRYVSPHDDGQSVYFTHPTKKGLKIYLKDFKIEEIYDLEEIKTGEAFENGEINYCPISIGKIASNDFGNEPCEISVEELIQSYDLVDIKAKDATLNLMLGLYKKYKGTNRLITIKSEIIKLALEELKEETEVELDKLEYLTFDGKNIIVKFIKDHKQNVPFKIFGISPAEMELSAETKWVMSLEEDEIISIKLVEGYGKVNVKWLYRKIAEQYGIKAMDIFNAALTTYTKDKKRSLYGVVFSDEKIFNKEIYPIDAIKLGDKNYLYKLNDMDKEYKPDYSYVLSLEGKERDVEWEKIRKQEEEIKKKYHHDFKINSNYYFYSDFNGIDVSNMGLGTINNGEGLNILYNWLNKQMTEKSLRLIFSENPNVFIPLASLEFIDNLNMLQLGASEAGYSMVPIYDPHKKQFSQDHQAFADSILKLVNEKFMEEVKIPDNKGGYYFYYIRKT